MNSERLKEVLEILSRYSNNVQVVDYYQLFGINQNMHIEDIKTFLKQKRVQVLFHPDQIKFIPAEYHEKYFQMVEVVKNMMATFDNFDSKVRYDRQLEQSKNNYNNEEQYYSSNNSYSNNSGHAQDLERFKFNNAIILNSIKYGFDFTLAAIKKIINENSTRGFTRDNNVRDTIESISRDKIISILSESSVIDNNLTVDELVMNYLTDLMYENVDLKKQVDALEHACVNTISKYDLNGKRGQTANAIHRFIETGNANGFTSTNGGRERLVENVSPMNMDFLIKCALNKKRKQNPNYDYRNFMNQQLDVVELYSSMLYNKVQEETYGGYNGGGFNR